MVYSFFDISFLKQKNDRATKRAYHVARPAKRALFRFSFFLFCVFVPFMQWSPTRHSANVTREYVFHQLIPYIGNKRKLLGLVNRAIDASGIRPDTHLFADLFAGTGVVGRFAKSTGYAVQANDWEPYSHALNRCALDLSAPPLFFGTRTYEDVLIELNALPGREDWVTTHLCPRNDDLLDHEKDRLFYTRANGMKIDAIREKIAAWEKDGALNDLQTAALLAPLLYQCSYVANTSGVFKGFHKGWGGQTGTALYRIKAELVLRPALFLDNGRTSHAQRLDAREAARLVPKAAFAYLDPPYNQHPYGSNYHVLNSVALWDKPTLSPLISGRGDKAAIRTDWRSLRRSAYNHAKTATQAYAELLRTLPATWIATSYSTEGVIPLLSLLEANLAIGASQVFCQPYKRYRVSSQRSSKKPMTVEFIVLTKKDARAACSAESLAMEIRAQEHATQDT